MYFFLWKLQNYVPAKVERFAVEFICFTYWCKTTLLMLNSATESTVKQDEVEHKPLPSLSHPSVQETALRSSVPLGVQQSVLQSVPSVQSDALQKHCQALMEQQMKQQVRYLFVPRLALTSSDFILVLMVTFLRTICDWNHLPPSLLAVSSFANNSLPSNRQHLSYDVCLEVRGKIIRTVLCCIVYWSCAQS